MDRMRFIIKGDLPIFRDRRNRVGYAFTLLLSIFAYILLFNPFEHSLFSDSSTSERILGSFVVAFVVSSNTMAAMYIIFFGRIESERFKLLHLILMCLIAMVASSLIFSISSRSLDNFVDNYLLLSKIVSLPYIFATLFATIGYLRMELQQQKELSTTSKEDSVEMIAFKDDSQKVIFYQERKSILYIEANDNYVKIYTWSGQEVRMTSMRCRMATIESQLSDKGFIRSHRSYIINSSLILSLKREKKKHFATLRDCDFPIPVSNTFVPEIMKLIEDLPQTEN